MKKLLLLLPLLFYNFTMGQSIVSVTPNNGNRGQAMTVYITGQDVDFSASTPTLQVSFIDQFSNILPMADFAPYSPTDIFAQFVIPGYAIPGPYSLNVYDTNGSFNITLPNAFTVNNQYTYTIQGNIHYDSNNNGCDASDPVMPNQKLVFTNGSTSGTLFADTSGFYSYYDVNTGSNSFSPLLENPSYFTVTPPSASVTLSTTNNLYVKDFCIAPNGVHNDLEVSIIPTSNARPGFNSSYKIIYKNAGTTTQSGAVNLAFDDSVMDLVPTGTVPSVDSQSTNALSWNFSNLAPLETRQILVMMNLNSPVESPPVNVGNTLIFTSTVVGATDESPTNNTATFSQTVVGSYDPNDKTCAEGHSIALAQVGKYLHYVIRFENTGTANAENVVIRDNIDTSKYDITSLRPLAGSHAFTTRIRNTNQVEFLFENINLPFDDANNDGYVSFKIKSKSTLVVGANISNKADIYFDYNAPITTNTFTTTVTALGVNPFEFDRLFTLSPVPAKSTLNITSKGTVLMSKVDIYNALGQMVLSNTDSLQSIDVSSLNAGNYFIKITSDKGTATSKFIKE